MRTGLIGMNYKLCDLELRELFARKVQLLKSLNIPLVLLSTCNRTEIYFSSSDPAAIHSLLVSQLKQEMGDFPDHCLYSYFGEKCFGHLAKVTAGLDSVIFGEAEIQRQVKEAYEVASSLYSLPSPLHFMFQKSLKIGKEIRTKFSLPKGQVSIESAISELIPFFFQQKEKDLSILFIGFSEINRKIAPFLRNKGFLNLSLVTRNQEAAQRASFDQQCTLLNWLELSHWPSYDIVVSGSLSSDYLLRQEDLKGERVQSRLVIDLSLPRNVDPSIEKYPSITLFNIEEMNQCIEQKQRGIFKEKQIIKNYIEEKVCVQTELYEDKKNRIFVCA